MRRLMILAVAVTAVLALAVSDAAPTASEATDQGKKKEATHTPPAVIHHAPAVGAGQPPVVHQPAVKAPVTPPIVHHAPSVGSQIKPPVHVEVPKVQPPVVKQNVKEFIQQNQPKFQPPVVQHQPPHTDVKSFVEHNKGKFTGPAGKAPVIKDIAKSFKVPRIEDKITVKNVQTVVQAQHARLGKEGIHVGGKVIDVGRRREDLAAAYNKNWQQRVDTRFQRAQTVRHELGTTYHHLFTPTWGERYNTVRKGWWGRSPTFAHAWYSHLGGQRAWHWWRPVTWLSFAGWAFPNAWGPPLYYDYGGNVIVENNIVYLDGQPIASGPEYYDQALALCDQGTQQLLQMPLSEESIETDWMPLGVFGLVNESQNEPAMFLQLAVNKAGVIAGSYTNTITDEALPVTGGIDPKTQRAAWYIGDNKETIMETGAYNLTLAETQVLIHFGPDRTQAWLMVRMPEPTQE